MTAREIFTKSVSATEHLPELLREHAGEVTGLQESVFDASHLEFLDEQIRLSPRGPEWSALLSRRRAALLPFYGVPLLLGTVSVGVIQFTVRVHPETRSVVHWEEDQMAHPMVRKSNISFARSASWAVLIMVGAHSLWLVPEHLRRGDESHLPALLGIELLLAAPALALLLGVRWAGFIVALECLALLPLWLLLPLALHSIERTGGFWLFWTLSFLALFYAGVASWSAPKKPYQRPAPRPDK